MDDFDEKLNSILSSPETMGQIMALANSLTGPQNQEQDEPPQTQQNQAPDLSALLQGMDSGMMQRIVSLLGEYNRGEDEKTKLLQSMRPFLREERRKKLDKAVQIARISRVIRSAIDQFRGEGHV